MRRREFVTLIGGAAAAWPLAAFGKTHRLAIVVMSVPVTLMTETADDPLFPALLKELRRLGYVEGQNLLIERYSGEGRASQYPVLARDVVSRNPDVIIVFTNGLVLDFKTTTTTIPKSKCASKLFVAAGKHAGAKTKCHAKALKAGVPVDQTCLAKAESKFAIAFARAQAQSDCVTGATVDQLGSDVDMLIEALKNHIAP